MDSSWGRQGPSSAPGSSRTAAAGASNGKGKGKGRGGGRRKGGRGGGGGGRGRGSKKRANDGGAKTSSSGGDDTGGGDSYSTLGKLVSKATKPTRETGYKHLDEVSEIDGSGHRNQTSETSQPEQVPYHY